MNSIRAVLLSVFLAGCASHPATPVDACLSEAGRGWSYLYLPPTNSAELRKLTDIPPATQILWFEKSAEALMACTHAREQGCTPMVYEFRKENGFWQAKWDRDAKVCQGG